ncbi:hypothetical protein BU24DRAFT_428595 [Aaosphaeria arxii CBS 175.79]|uniref:F-box domain-containing protein n=1 Tax=Aaosphaeria arxii CBS 175.79 TaxID=1450172 RepID=A0A6A5XAA6_9PLEO|nr:uncharacterized protein BU24DRAFT_428595 [Aaosphaeria arxii CBS 175.79]KAF2009704.1 hypothetical protein BU24DRAFT_428595 [Aaosphaeria arxii CBS 175.79]
MEIQTRAYTKHSTPAHSMNKEAARRSNHQNLLVRLLGDGAPYPIFNEICYCLDVLDIIRVSRTCVGLATVYSRLRRTHWNINQKLLRFVDRPVRFRGWLGRLDALISGGFALQFFARTVWLDSDLNIYVNASGDALDGLLGDLQDHEGYNVTNQYFEDGNYTNSQSLDGVFSITDLSRPARGDGGQESRIQVIRCHIPPMSVILGGSHNTGVINVISSQAAYCLFPASTFGKRHMIILGRRTRQEHLYVEKYLLRGWNIREEPLGWAPGMERYPEQLPLECNKLSGDPKSTWKIELDVEGITPPSELQTRMIECAHVSIGRRPNSHDFVQYEIRPPFGFVSIVLKGEYLCADEEWRRWLERKLNDRIKTELQGLDVKDRPPFFDDFMYTRHMFTCDFDPDWKPPLNSSWNYYDDLIWEWFDDWRYAKHCYG